ncbi:hypothetical protein [Urbifossiella limnaea]|uniref:Thioredoxin domain-containing protein n=1 Tax=Urbifossiella limnaea TaxID=2528023 RepID=A0A517XVA9_9BACT|nr:hypothetical protein [Urbifossiella limnaea]QDU21414.1 hypothetical protein ETAA1_33810 [Urbifossiella limnaea]
MFRTVTAAAVTLVAAAITSAAPPPDGNYLLSGVTPLGDSPSCILKLETTDGKQTASVLYAPKGTDMKVSGYTATDKSVTFTVQQFVTQPNGQKFQFVPSRFVGTPGADGKTVVGSGGADLRPTRMKLTATDATEFTRATTGGGPAAAAYKAVGELQQKAFPIQIKLQQEKDPAVKKELLKQLADARQEVTEKMPVLLREVVAKHPDSVAGAEAAMGLLRVPTTKLAAGEAQKLVGVIRKQGEVYGKRFVDGTERQLADILAPRTDVGDLGVKAIEPVVKAMKADAPAADRVATLQLYETALKNAGMTAKAKGVEAEIAKLETVLDEEYHKTVPPFKPDAFAGRKDSKANRAVVMELFTGAQCPPCVAADVAFDALGKSYGSKDLVLIQYHMHIPGPDPLTNKGTIARWDYYRERFPEGIRGTPSTLFNGTPKAGGGGGMANAEAKYGAYTNIINPLLEESTSVKLTGKATRTGDKVEIGVEYAGVPTAGEPKLRLLLVEDTVKYVGSNKLRFHHAVVRAMPGGAAGTALKAATGKQAVSVDVSQVRAELSKYLDDFAANERPFPTSARPLEMAKLQVIALVQDDATGEVLHAARFDVGPRGPQSE